MGKYYLSEKIGAPVVMVAPQSHATDLVGSDHTGVAINGFDSVLFILVAGSLTGDSVTVSITYSSTGVASDASASTTVWAASDMTFVAMDSDQDNGIAMLDLNVGNRVAVTDNGNTAGKFYAAAQCVGDGIWSVIGIPYNGRLSPTTNTIATIRR